MFGIPLIEWVGYAASICIAISLIMTSVYKLRMINTVGCLLFVIYGFVVHAYPVAVANLVIVFINLYQLYRLHETGEKHRAS